MRPKKRKERHLMALIRFFPLMAFSSLSYLAFPQSQVGFSMGFFIFSLGLASYASFPTRSKEENAIRFRAGFVAAWCIGASRLWSMTFFPNLLVSSLVVGGVMALVVIVHFLFPKPFVYIYSEQLNPSTEFSKRLLALSMSVLPGIALMGASFGRALSRQYPENSLNILAGLSFLCALIFAHVSLSDFLYLREQSGRGLTKLLWLRDGYPLSRSKRIQKYVPVVTAMVILVCSILVLILPALSNALLMFALAFTIFIVFVHHPKLPERGVSQLLRSIGNLRTRRRQP